MQEISVKKAAQLMGKSEQFVRIGLQRGLLPVSKLIVKARANYLNYIAKLSNILGKVVEDDDGELNEYE